MRKRETPEADPATPAQDAPRGRRKWVTHGLSNRVVYGGLHYGARWLPLPVLHGISLFGNSLAVTFMHETLGASARTSASRSAFRSGRRGGWRAASFSSTASR